MPETWSQATITKAFTAPAWGHSEPVECMVNISEQPKPWVGEQAWTAAGYITLRLPEPIAAAADLQLSGHLDDGRELMNMHYQVCVGELTAE